MVAAAELSFTDLIDDQPDTFQVHTDAYMDASVFDAEMRRTLERTWVYVGHESQVPAVGDYRTTAIGRQPVIMSRHEDGEIYVLLNRCRHRGSVVCPRRGRPLQLLPLPVPQLERQRRRPGRDGVVQRLPRGTSTRASGDCARRPA